MRATVAALAALPALVASLRPLIPLPLGEDEDGTNSVPGRQAARTPSPAAVPSRRIQYLYENKAGLADRMSVFTFLNNVAHFHNATAHIPGGRLSARSFLDDMHSASIAEDWGFYLDTNANNGNPFHLADTNATNVQCRNVTDSDTDWSHIFDDGGQCVNIVRNYYHYSRLRVSEFHNNLYRPTFSVNVQHAVQQAVKDVVGPFGLLHVRRCDLLKQNKACTDPDFVNALVSMSGVTSWLVFTFAEIGYLPALQERLKKTSRQRFLYEDDIFSGIEPADDNYLRYGAVDVLQKKASQVIELRKCSMSSLAKLPDNWADTNVSDSLEVTLQMKGVCNSDDAVGPYTPRER